MDTEPVAKPEGEGWVPFGTHAHCGKRMEFSDYDEGGLPTWERVVVMPECGCWTCLSEVPSGFMGLPLTATMMVLCPDCGNKRCPRATHHDNACTGSNEPGQEGSRYPSMFQLPDLPAESDWFKGGYPLARGVLKFPTEDEDA